MSELNYEELRRMAMERAKATAARLYPPEAVKERQEAETRLTNRYYRELISLAG